MATNIKGELKGSVLTLTIDLGKKGGASKSKKSVLIAKTGGNVSLGDIVKTVPEEMVDIKIGVNVYVPAD